MPVFRLPPNSPLFGLRRVRASFFTSSLLRAFLAPPSQSSSSSLPSSSHRARPASFTEQTSLRIQLPVQPSIILNPSCLGTFTDLSEYATCLCSRHPAPSGFPECLPIRRVRPSLNVIPIRRCRLSLSVPLNPALSGFPERFPNSTSPGSPGRPPFRCFKPSLSILPDYRPTTPSAAIQRFLGLLPFFVPRCPLR